MTTLWTPSAYTASAGWSAPLRRGFLPSCAVTGSELPPMMTQVGIQIFSVAATLIYGGIVSFVILFVIKKTMGLRVTKDEELTGLDLAIHGERIE